MMSLRSLHLILLTMIVAASPICCYALSDAELNALRDGFNARSNQMLTSQVSSPYPSYETNPVWNLQDYALAAFYLDTEVDQANAAMIEACDLILNNPDCPSDCSLHWQLNLMFRIYEYFNAESSHFPGRLTPAAETKICEVMWFWMSQNSLVSDADIVQSKTWWLWGSENHDAQHDTSTYSAAAILKDVAAYDGYTLSDGYTIEEHYDAWNTYFKEYLRERGKKGLLIEVASPTYAKYTLQGWYNFYDFAEDAGLRYLAQMALDLWWADWAHDQINGIRGGGKSRVYQDGPDTNPTKDGAYSMCWYYFNIGQAASKHPGIMCLATSNYRVPLVVMDLALDISGRGSYEFKSRRPGAKIIPQPTNLPADTYAADPCEGRIHRYTYATPYFVLGSYMTPKIPHDEWTAISDQNRWFGAIFASDAQACIVPECEGIPLDYGKTYNQQWAVQDKGTLITQKIIDGYSTHTGDMRIYFARDKFTLVEDSGWVFTSTLDGNAYAAVRPAWGSYSWDDTNWLCCDDDMAPVIIEVAPATDHSEFFALFRSAVKNNTSISVNSGVLTYTSLSGKVFTFYTDGASTQRPEVDGEPVDYAPDYTFDSPFMHEDWASGVVTINKDGRSAVLDFVNLPAAVCGDAGYLPGDLNSDCYVDVADLQLLLHQWLSCELNDDASTKALWRMDGTFSDGTNVYVPDDDSANLGRDRDLKLGPGVSKRPTLVAPGYDDSPGCLSFDGSDDEAIATSSWGGYDSVSVTAMVYPTDGAGSNVIVEATSTWSLGIGNDNLTFTTWHSNGVADVLPGPSLAFNQWQRLEASVDELGNKTVSIDGIRTSRAVGAPLKVQTKSLTMGNKPGYTRYYDGLVDDVKISTYQAAGLCSDIIDMGDFSVLAHDWMMCTDPAGVDCISVL